MAATGDVLDLPGLSTALISMVILATRWRGLAAGTATTHLVRTMALLAPADLPCCGVGVCPSAGRPRSGGTHVGCKLPGACSTPTPSRWCSAGVFLQPFFQLWRHRLRVEEVRQESPDVVSMLMSGDHLNELRAEPGQFFRWRFLTRSDMALGVPVLTLRSHPPATDCGSPSRHAARERGRS